jgi:hypothetical protein
MRKFIHAGIFKFAILCVVFAFYSTGIKAADRDFIEVQVDAKTWQGQVLAHNAQDFWFLGRDGKIHRFPVPSVKKFRSLAPTFRGLSAKDLRSQLRVEFGREYEIVGTGHYLVVAPKGRGKKFAPVFEDVYRTLYGYLSVCGFRLQKPKYPLVAIVFPNQAKFIEYARRDNVRNSTGLQGYYHPRTNRVAMFDLTGKSPGSRTSNLQKYRTSNTVSARVNKRANSVMIDIIIHETTHQVAFNVGLHSRIGKTPKWIAEGLATTFEVPAIRERKGRRGSISRANRSRLLRFQNYVKHRHQNNSLETFIASDALFQTNALDAYSQGWALTFFLLETRSRKYANYLKVVAAREPLKQYTSKQRVADFKKAFGNNLPRLEIDMLRFISRLK